MMFFQGITVYPDSAGHWRFVLASGDRCVTHPLQFRSEEQALQIARVSSSFAAGSPRLPPSRTRRWTNSPLRRHEPDRSQPHRFPTGSGRCQSGALPAR